MKRRLILEDGSVFEGTAIGSDNFKIGELVFTTGMCGYQETMSDPSFYGQLVVMSYPLIGNYGINDFDSEHMQTALFGLIVKESCDEPNHGQMRTTLDEYMKIQDIPGIAGVDTRELTRKLRDAGSQKATFANIEDDVDEVLKRLKAHKEIHNHVEMVSCKTSYCIPSDGKRVVLIDFGAKLGIVKELKKRNCEVIVVPHTTSAKEILDMHPDGIMLSNGPGDPKDNVEAIATIKELFGKCPIFGICLGHQLLALASGADTKKLPFGHRGVNHPVKNLETGRVEITSQNHGYAVDENSLSETGFEVSHIAINDKSVEGLVHTTYPIFSVQYHPESNPGPNDSIYLFDQFINLMEGE